MEGMAVQLVKQHLKRKETLYLFICHSWSGEHSKVLQLLLLANLAFTLICRWRKRQLCNYRLLEWALSGTSKNPNSKTLNFYFVWVQLSKPMFLVHLSWISIWETFEARFQWSCVLKIFTFWHQIVPLLLFSVPRYQIFAQNQSMFLASWQMSVDSSA